MRKLPWCSGTFIGVLLAMLGASSVVRAQTASEPGTGEPQGPGQLIVVDPQTGAKVRLPITRYRARVVLQPPQALVQIEQSFDNPYGEQDEGTFAINLPVGASVCRFSTQAAGGPLREAELADRQPLRGAVSAPGAGQKEASILEEVGTYLFRIRLPEVAGQGAHRIWFDYTVPLVAEQGTYQFKLPLRSDLQPVGQFEVSGTITPPVDVESVHVEWQGPSTSVPPTVHMPRRADGGLDFEWRAENTPLPDALKVEYREPAGRTVRVRTYTAREKDGVGTAWQHFVVTIPADEAEADKLDTGPIDVQIVADTSGSMRDFGVLPQTVRRIVAALRPEDQFQLGCVDAEYRPVTQDCTTAKSAAAEEALKSLDHDLPLGTSNLWHALSTAGSALERSAGDRRQALIYVGDGISTDGPGDGDWRKVRLPRGVTVSAVQLGEDEHGSEFLRNFVEAGGGRLFRVGSDPRELQDVLAWLRRGLPQPKPIKDLRISAGEDLEWFTPESWPAGQDLVICGRCRPTHSVRVALMLQGAPLPREFSLDVPTDDGTDFFVGRLWAQRQLAELQSHGPDEDQERTEVVRLGQEWSLVTPYSAYLVPGDGLEFSRWLAGRGYRRRYWEPPGSESVAVGAELRRVRIDRRPLVGPSREARQALAERDFLETLGGRRGLLDRSAVATLPVADPLLRSLALGGMSPEYLEHHPFAAQLLRRLTLDAQTMSLADFVKLLARETGIKILLDEQTLADAGISPDQEVSLPAVQQITARSLLKIMLQNVGGVELDYMLDEHLLQISTKERADEGLSNAIYPVVDLVRTDVLPSPEWLADPFRELERAVQRRIKARLQEPITVHFDATPLADAAKQFASHLGVTVFLDEQTLNDAGVALDQPVSLSLENVAAGRVLDVLLQNVGGVELDYFYQDEVFTITTNEKSDEALATRIYPLVGIVYDVPPGLIPARSAGGGGIGMGGAFGGEEAAFSGGRVDDPGFSVIGPPRKGAGESYVDDSPPSWGPKRINWPGGKRPDFARHLEELIELIQDQTEGPWQDLDGIGGTMDAFLPSLSLIVRQTERVHREIEELLNQLHELPPASALVRPARVPRITADDQAGWDCSSVIDFVQNMTEGPWQNLDGIGGTINAQPQTMTLFVRQTRRVHEQIYEVLSDLRRSRYVAEGELPAAGIRPVDEYPLFGEETRVTDLPAARRRDALPAPGDEELRLLAACRLEPVGRSEWLRILSDGENERLMLTATEPRLEFELAQRRLRAEDDRAAVAYPGLTLVELGPWGEAVRELADARLPWLPHRSNADLARLYAVTQESADEQRTTLRLTFPDLNDAYFLASFSRENKLPVEWEAHLNGKRRYRLQFEYEARQDAGDTCRVTLEDSTGAVRERWEMLSADPSATVPELLAGCEGYVVDDPDQPDGLYRRARSAVAAYDYDEAARLLRESLPAQPRQPLLNLLLAWMIEFTRERETSRLRQESSLRTVARSGAADLVRLIATHNFPGFDDEQLYALLLEQPAEQRTAGNWDRLADLAGALGRQEERRQHIEAALRQTSERSGGELRMRLLQRIDAFLRLQRPAEAAQQADELLAAAGGRADRLSADVADVFYAAGDLERGDGYLTRALGGQDVSPAVRKELLIREARWRKGVARWRLLLQAAELSGEDHRQRGSLVAQIVGEISEPQDVLAAGLLSEEAHDAEVKTLFKLHEAELTLDHEAAAAIALSMQAVGRVPADRFEWLVTTVLQGQRYEEAARLLEDRVRSGRRLNDGLREKLLQAYKALGWQREVRRAESDVDEEPYKSAPQPQAPQWPFPGGFGGGGFF